MRKGSKREHPDFRLDLHGTSLDEIPDKLDRFLRRLPDGAQALVIPGKGEGKAMNLVKDYLKRAGYHFRFEKTARGDNTGALWVS